MNSTINALEAEKADMVEKLSKAKQEAVRIVQVGISVRKNVNLHKLIYFIGRGVEKTR